MFSLLFGQVSSSSTKAALKANDDREGQNSKLSIVHEFSHVGSYLTSVNLIICILVASTLIQSTLALISRSESREPDYASQEWKPCICNSTFYKYCPKASECVENNIEDIVKRPPPIGLDFMAGHDDMHPDHVDIAPSFGPYGLGNGLDLGADEERVVRHRKVYVAPRKAQIKPFIHTIAVRIPLSMPTVEPSNIPEAKSMYKLKKYTTYENRPEIQMVPVTKTIIKPVGVSPDQFIDDGSAKLLA